MTAYRLLAALLTFLLLGACANVSKDFAFDPVKPTGLVIGSVSFESGLGKYFLVVKGGDAEKQIDLGFGCPIFPCLEPANDAPFSEGETPKQRGGGFAVEVPAGRYRVVGWKVVRGSLVDRSTAPVDVEFLVEKGKVSYLGNLHFDGDWENVRLRDKAARDMPLLKERFPVLKTATLAYTVAPGAEVDHVGGEYRRSMNGVIFIPIAPVR